jgi:hypothetical protein
LSTATAHDQIEATEDQHHAFDDWVRFQKERPDCDLFCCAGFHAFSRIRGIVPAAPRHGLEPE